MNYSVKAFLIYAVAMVVVILLNEFSEIVFNAVHISFLGLLMFGTSMLVHHLTIKASEENANRFPAYFMAITGLKMMAYVLLLGTYVFMFKETATPVVIAFLFFYLAFTVLEVVSAISELKKVG